jgi:hypothetical protein
MGQKVNPEIFKLSRTAGWKSKYLEGKKINLGLYAMKDFGVKTFTKHFFTKIGLNVHSCKLAYLNGKLIIQTNYIKSLDVLDGMQAFNTKAAVNPMPIIYERIRNEKLLIKALIMAALLYEINPQIKSPLNPEKRASVYPFLQKTPKNFNNKTSSCTTSKPTDEYRDATSKFDPLILKNSVIKTTKRIASYLSVRKSKASNENPCVSSYSFINSFFKSFSLYYNKPLQITLIFKSLQKNIMTTKPCVKKNVLQKSLVFLRKYKRNAFFHKGINLMFLMTSKKEAADSIATYIAHTLRNFKKHKFFLKFIQKGLFSFSKIRTVIKAVKIQLKGRINGADRARSYSIKAGNQLSLLTTSSRINYSEKTTFTPDGTLSVKVWIRYRKTLKQFRSQHRP